MIDRMIPPTMGDVFYRMFLAGERRAFFSESLAGLLQMDAAELLTLYDQPAPDPLTQTFATDVRSIATRVGCDPAVLAELLHQWPPEVESSIP